MNISKQLITFYKKIIKENCNSKLVYIMQQNKEYKNCFQLNYCIYHEYVEDQRYH